jgi:UDP-GlcNAc:undecaprenyl-phosphate GlcNAc-1-phosphate transferase
MDISLQESAPFKYFFIAGFSFFLVFLGIPSIIHIANKLKLFDNNKDARKTHRYGISRLGGIAVFCSLFITTLLFSDFDDLRIVNYLLTAFILIFAVGLKDDLWGVNPSTKFFIQLLCALVVVLLADIRISNLHGIFHIYQLPYWISVCFSTILIIFITNSFNLIDGIDGLVGVTSLLATLIFGLFFAYMGMSAFACMAFAVSGAVLGFLKFNIPPARIFMGDAGSMLIGLVCSILAIKFIELNLSPITGKVAFISAPAIGMAVLIGPIFDVLRVFFLRLMHRSSPFVADNNHIHHCLLRLNFNHRQATLVLMVFNNSLLSMVLYFKDLGNVTLITLMFAICLCFHGALTLLIREKEGQGLPVRRLSGRFGISAALRNPVGNEENRLSMGPLHIHSGGRKVELQMDASSTD